jgi:chromosome segregation protein
MLKRLELIGFKSFADRTRFDFAPGVTAVVGPNGSGKSNIVDAVRWLLGEQSAKALRGAEMTDVIFNGSSTRKSLGMAEVTMTFDNVERHLDHPADEVQVTRRVYRDGRGEYLLNGHEVRLKDVKDVFLGSGAGHGAYSVIEQGRVDALLTSSAKDRRLIFEEAAGISRFKAKKLETLRKLDRVDTDLIRVHDILQELDKQLRTLRLQASKAEKYREYHAAQKTLRVGVGLRDFRRLSATLDAESADLARSRERIAADSGESSTGEADLKKLDGEAVRTGEALRAHTAQLAATREAIVTLDAAAKAERGHLDVLGAEALRLGTQRATLGRRTRALERDAERHEVETATATDLAAAESLRAAGIAAARSATVARLADLNAGVRHEREKQFDAVGREARAASESEGARGHLDRLDRDLARKAAEAVQTRIRHGELQQLLDGLSQSDSDVRERHAETQARLRRVAGERDALAAEIVAAQGELERLREERSGLRARAEILEGWEASREGFGAGVRAVLARLDAGDPVLSPAIVGLVGDLLRAPRDIAALVDIALGDVAQRFVVAAANFDAAALQGALGGVPGRVGFLPLKPESAARLPPHGSRPPPLPLAEVVHSECVGLSGQLLGRTFVVETLTDALDHAVRHPGYRFVTLCGEFCDADGTVTVGPTQADAGILSRKSELRELRGKLHALEVAIAGRDATHLRLRQESERLAGEIGGMERELATLSGEAGTLRERILEQRQTQRQLAERLDLLAAETRVAEAEAGRVRAAVARLQGEASAATAEVQLVNAKLDELVRGAADAERDRERQAQDHTTAQVAVSRVTEQLAGLRKKKAELDAEARQRRVDASTLIADEHATRQRHLETTLTVLRATAQAATHYADKDARTRVVRELNARRDIVQAARAQSQASLKDSRSATQEQQQAAHARELVVRDLLNQRDAVVARLREDFALDLRQLAEDGTPVELPADPADEIEELRRKIVKLGSVNVEAIAELAELARREGELRAQFDDLSQGRKALQAIIDEINTESRKLFTDMLTVVRQHFQELFRKVFGGGQADIVLDDESDVLESGIEITAHPPGKQAQSLSLLSGGERALTAAALLLAIFRSKPSPFCLLDEIDAAMDEANTARLADLVREYSHKTQFIVITHKKRTMARADVLHGVTMQESGVSRLVAVRFEDWPEDDAAPARRAA